MYIRHKICKITQDFIWDLGKIARENLKKKVRIGGKIA